MQKVPSHRSNSTLMQIKAFLDITQDIQGFVGFSEAHHAVIVALRGTTDVKSWLASNDFKQVSYPKCGGCQVHEGFYNGYAEVSATVKDQVQLIFDKYRSATLIYVTGHSLGGAIATVAALDLKATFGKVSEFYSYGEPRVGNVAFATYFDSQIPVHRVIHYADIVPHVPPYGLNYTHGGAQYWYDEEMQIYRICTAEDNTCANSLPETALNIKDHQLSTYLQMPTSLLSLRHD